MESGNYPQYNWGPIWYTRDISTSIQQGWQCPCCKTVYAPWIKSCKCQKASSRITINNPYWSEEEWYGETTFPPNTA